MGRLRRHGTLSRASLAILGVTLVSCSPQARSGDSAAKAPTETIVIRNLESPGAVEIENKGPAQTLWSQMRLQGFENGVWHDENGMDLMILETCEWNRQPGCQTLEHGAKLRPVAWNGLSCGGQCGGTCRANAFLGPGQFRFVVTTCDKKRSFYGPVFTMPDYDHSELKKSGR